MSEIKSKLAQILGNKLPKTARSFHTYKEFAVFCNRKGNLMFRKLSKSQIEQLKKEQLWGSLGFYLD